MKNQYLADIGDYGKYGLLRFLAANGLRIGVNWYLTRDDGSRDGRFKAYLERPPEPWMADGELFEALRRINSEPEPTVRRIEESGLIPGAVYYTECLDLNALSPRERAAARETWFDGALEIARGTDLIFADPDNGVSFRVTASEKNNEKFILPAEVGAYFARGRDVVFYCHKGRRSETAWQKVRADVKIYLDGMGTGAELMTLTYHKGTQRSYVFAVHPERADAYWGLLRRFTQTAWGRVFDLEPQD